MGVLGISALVVGGLCWVFTAFFGRMFGWPGRWPYLILFMTALMGAVPCIGDGLVGSFVSPVIFGAMILHAGRRTVRGTPAEVMELEKQVGSIMYYRFQRLEGRAAKVYWGSQVVIACVFLACHVAAAIDVWSFHRGRDSANDGYWTSWRWCANQFPIRGKLGDSLTGDGVTLRVEDVSRSSPKFDYEKGKVVLHVALAFDAAKKPVDFRFEAVDASGRKYPGSRDSEECKRRGRGNVYRVVVEPDAEGLELRCRPRFREFVVRLE